MDRNQIEQEDQALTELVDAELNDICLSCGGSLEVTKTSTGIDVLICPRCDAMSKWAY